MVDGNSNQAGVTQLDAAVRTQIAASPRGCDRPFSDMLGNPWHRQNIIVTRTGEQRRMRWSNKALRSEDGTVIGTASIDHQPGALAEAQGGGGGRGDRGAITPAVIHACTTHAGAMPEKLVHTGRQASQEPNVY